MFRYIVQHFQTDHFVIQLIGPDCLTIDDRFKIALESMCSMCLLRDREGLLSAGDRSHRTPDLVPIQNEVDDLLHISGRHIGKRNRSHIGD